MTLNDLERCNSPYFAFFSPNLIPLQADYVTVVEDRPTIFVKYFLLVPSSTFGQNWRILQRSLSAIAELLVTGFTRCIATGQPQYKTLYYCIAEKPRVAQYRTGNVGLQFR